jgi:hypothetical protein
MMHWDPEVTALMTARREGRPEESLQLLLGLLGELDADPRRFSELYFITIFEWSLLVEDYAPARTALALARDEQVRRLLDGDEITAGPGPGAARAHSRFSLVVEMNRILKDDLATHALFVRLLALQPARAAREAYRVLPAIVAAGDFALARSYLRDPMADLVRLNQLASELPLFPASREGARTPPRLASELTIFIQDVALNVAVLQGLGQPEDAQSLRQRALSGIVSEEVRALGERELNAPGTISKEITARMEPPAAAVDPASPV